jgi:hypothetical protein
MPSYFMISHRFLRKKTSTTILGNNHNTAFPIKFSHFAHICRHEDNSYEMFCVPVRTIQFYVANVVVVEPILINQWFKSRISF